jgi:peptidyl-prolyl cis-trans isomerase B (cyclophilin B)
MTYEYSPEPSAPISSTSVAAPQPTNAKPADKPRFNTLAVVSFALSLLSALSIPAIIIGHFAINDLKKSGERGRVLAILGLVFGYLTLAAAIAFSVLFFAALVESIRHYQHDGHFWQNQFDQLQQGIDS